MLKETWFRFRYEGTVFHSTWNFSREREGEEKVSNVGYSSQVQKDDRSIEDDMGQGIFEIGSVSCLMHSLDLQAVDFLPMDSRRRE